MVVALTDEILPVKQLLTIRIDIVCASKQSIEDGKKQGMALGIKRVLDLLDAELDEETSKKCKTVIDPLIETPLEPVTNYLVPATQSVNTTPDEDSLTAHIIAQLKTFAVEQGLEFNSNVAKITAYATNKYTKYGLSRPDTSSHNTTSYISGIISTRDHTRTAFLSSSAESLPKLSAF